MITSDCRSTGAETGRLPQTWRSPAGAASNTERHSKRSWAAFFAGVGIWLAAGFSPPPAWASEEVEPYRTLLVLPFYNLTVGAESGLAESLVDDVSRRLARLPGLQVRLALPGALDQPAELDRTARDHEAEVVLEGSVRLGADGMRVTAQLIRGADSYQIWGKLYSRGLFEHESLVSEMVADIRLQLGY